MKSSPIYNKLQHYLMCFLFHDTSYVNTVIQSPLFQLYLYDIIHVSLSHLTPSKPALHWSCISHTPSKRCSKGHFGNNCNDTCDGCISELCNRFDGVCDMQDQCKAGLDGVKCDRCDH
jgi:hypothetical protein